MTTELVDPSFPKEGGGHSQLVRREIRVTFPKLAQTNLRLPRTLHGT